MSVENLSGQTVGQYQLRELLGSGGMGAVYRAYQMSLKREVAVKVLPSNLVGEPGYFERFTREAEIAASLEHPHIVPVYDYGTQGKISFVVMRRLTGGSLADRLKQGKQPSLGETASLLTQLASALDYAHSQDVVHRDIKPNNVMFDNHGSAYLVDFGIAKLLTSATQLTGTGMVIGTPPYIAPELWRGEEASPASDQYALAAMAYLLVTGNPPFEATTAPGMMYKHLNEMPTPAHTRRTGTPEAVTMILERGLAKDPAARFPTITALAQTFEGAVQGVEGTPTQFFNAPPRPKRTPEGRAASQAPTAVTVPPPSLSSGGRAAPRSARPIIALAAVLVIAAAGAILILGQNRSGAPSPKETPSEIAAAPAGLLSDTPAPASSLTQSAPPPVSETPAPTQTPLVPSDTPQPSAVPSATIDVLAQVWRPYTLTAESWTPTPNLTATFDQLETAAAATVAAGNQIATQAAIASIPVAHNADWTPIIQDINFATMVLVPEGCFEMGNDPDAIDGTADGGHICFDQPFWIDRTEVTNSQFRYFGGVAVNSSYLMTAGRPREQITWAEARDYCALRGARLPTEAEWEYAARGPDDWFFPWGNDFNPANAVWNTNHTADVGGLRSGASWVGALDMSGNVWEWVSSANDPYPYNANDGREDSSRTNVKHVLRGGSWFGSAPIFLRAATRSTNGPGFRFNSIGVRCARSFGQ
jgi:serine/threonine protein kinase/formylglycine-generating enzyme required for sulfatase activity